MDDSESLYNGSDEGCWGNYQQPLYTAFDGNPSTQTCFNIFDGTHGTALSFSTRTQINKYSIVQVEEGQSAYIWFATKWNMFESTDGGATWTKWQNEEVADTTAPSLLSIEDAGNVASSWTNTVMYSRPAAVEVSQWGDCSAEGSVCAGGLGCMWQNAHYAQCLTHCPGGDWGDCQKPTATSMAQSSSRKKVMHKRKKDAMQMAISAKGAAANTEYKYRWQPTDYVLCSVKAGLKIRRPKKAWGGARNARRSRGG